jgi:hypothetical protein
VKACTKDPEPESETEPATKPEQADTKQDTVERITDESADALVQKIPSKSPEPAVAKPPAEKEQPVAEEPRAEEPSKQTHPDNVEKPIEDKPAPAPESSPRDDDDMQAYSLERSGRKAAKEAAEKLKGKKNKRREKLDKPTSKTAEEDPWVQCDRCHKWRHLPATVNLDSLPEHWFCELNTFDEKRNNCDAPEQTPKDVAKEKKKMAKKLAWKKLQLEQAEGQGEWDGKASPREGDKDSEGGLKRKRSTSPDPNDEVKEDVAAGGESPKVAKPKKRGRPRNEDRLKSKEEKGGKDDKK